MRSLFKSANLPVCLTMILSFGGTSFGKSATDFSQPGCLTLAQLIVLSAAVGVVIFVDDCASSGACSISLSSCSRNA